MHIHTPIFVGLRLSGEEWDLAERLGKLRDMGNAEGHMGLGRWACAGREEGDGLGEAKVVLYLTWFPLIGEMMELWRCTGI